MPARLFCFTAFLFLFSCGDSVVEGTDSSASGNLYVHAIDAVSGTPVSGAEFFLPAVDKSPRKPSGTGGAVYRNLPIGENYAVSVSAAGYAPVVCDASIRLAENHSGFSPPLAENTTLSVSLRRLSSSLRGSFFYQNHGNPLQLELSPARGAEVSVAIQDEIACSYSRKIFGPVVVGGDGYYSFDSLPEMASYVLIAHDAVLGGTLYGGLRSEGVLGASGNAAILPRMVYSTAHTAFGFAFNSDNRSSAEKSDTLKFSFSEPVNVSLLRHGDLSVYKADANQTPVAADFTWGNSGRSLSIFPAFSDWEPGKNYFIRMKLYSLISSKTIDTTLAFLVNEFFDMSKTSVGGIKLDNPSVNYNTSSVILRWNALANAEAYEIYAKSSARFDAVYGLLGEVTSRTGGALDTSFAFPTSNLFLNGDSVLILIAARNGKGRSAFGNPFHIRDNMPPWFTDAGLYAIAPDTANYRVNATSAFNGTVVRTVLLHNVSFNEPMDTSSVLRAAIPAQIPRPVSVEFKWTSMTALSISLIVEAGAINMGSDPIKIPVAISGLSDKAKNLLRESSVGARKWRDLVILLHADGVL